MLNQWLDPQSLPRSLSEMLLGSSLKAGECVQLVNRKLDLHAGQGLSFEWAPERH